MACVWTGSTPNPPEQSAYAALSPYRAAAAAAWAQRALGGSHNRKQSVLSTPRAGSSTRLLCAASASSSSGPCCPPLAQTDGSVPRPRPGWRLTHPSAATAGTATATDPCVLLHPALQAGCAVMSFSWTLTRCHCFTRASSCTPPSCRLRARCCPASTLTALTSCLPSGSCLLRGGRQQHSTLWTTTWTLQ